MLSLGRGLVGKSGGAVQVGPVLKGVVSRGQSQVVPARLVVAHPRGSSPTTDVEDAPTTFF